MDVAPLYQDIAKGPDGGAAHWLATSDGVRIRVAHWPAPNAKGTILLFPGRTEYIEKYGRTAKSFAERGYACVAIDWRGQGLSDRLHSDRSMGHVADFKHYQRDVAAVMRHVAELDLPKPLFVIGHSMGGAIALRALMEGLDVKACGFSAPMWGVQGKLHMRAFIWSLTAIASAFGFSGQRTPGQARESYVLWAPFEDNTLTTDPASFDMLKDMLERQPDLGLGGPSLAFVGTVLRETRALAALPSPDIDCLTFVGTNEAIVDTDRIKNRMAKWPRGKLRIMQGGQHEMFVDKPEYRDALLDGFAQLFDANLPS